MPGSTAAPWATVPTAAGLHLGVRPVPASNSPQGKMEQRPCSARDTTLHISTMSGGCPRHRVPLRQQPGTYHGAAPRCQAGLHLPSSTPQTQDALQEGCCISMLTREATQLKEEPQAVENRWAPQSTKAPLLPSPGPEHTGLGSQSPIAWNSSAQVLPEAKKTKMRSVYASGAPTSCH